LEHHVIALHSADGCTDLLSNVCTVTCLQTCFEHTISIALALALILSDTLAIGQNDELPELCAEPWPDDGSHVDTHYCAYLAILAVAITRPDTATYTHPDSAAY
jgi:hypothetical protein